MPKTTFRLLSYAELQLKLHQFEDKFGEPLPELESLLKQTRLMQERMYETLAFIAAFHDTSANEELKATGKYSSFDEPHAVKTARELLQEL